LEGYPRIKVKSWRESSLVVSPSGIAMAQGDVHGVLRWDELQNVQLGEKTKHFEVSDGSGYGGIALHVPAAVIRIADVYDRPLPFIASVIGSYWRPAAR
jgi:hypothetical protein